MEKFVINTNTHLVKTLSSRQHQPQRSRPRLRNAFLELIRIYRIIKDEERSR